MQSCYYFRWFCLCLIVSIGEICHLFHERFSLCNAEIASSGGSTYRAKVGNAMRRLLPQNLLAKYSLEGKDKKEFGEPFRRTIHAVLQRCEPSDQTAPGYKDALRMVRSVLKVSSFSICAVCVGILFSDTVFKIPEREL